MYLCNTQCVMINNYQVYIYSEETGGVELQEKEVKANFSPKITPKIVSKVNSQFDENPHQLQGGDSQMSRRSTPAPQRRSRLTKSLSVGDSLGSESLLRENNNKTFFHYRLPDKGGEDQGWRDRPGRL